MVQIAKARSIVPISLNKRLGPNSEASLEDRISDPNAEMASEAAERSYDSVEVLYALSCLNDRERSVIGDRFGLSKDSDPQTLEEIGVKLQVTRERVRQIEAMALFKMHRYMVKRNSLTEGKPLKNVTNGQYINSKPSVLKEHLVNKRNGENRHH